MPIVPEGIPFRRHVYRPRFWLRHLYLRLRRYKIIKDTLNQQQLQHFHNLHKGKRAFIIGNGPSLKKTDLSLLANEITFCTNRFYLMLPTLNFTPTYYVAVNLHVLEQFSSDIVNLHMPAFVPWYAFPLMQTSNNMHFLDVHLGLDFATDVRQGLWTGVTVTYATMQIAYYMGFKEVYLIGVDHHFESKGKPHKVVLSQGHDPDHFHHNYFGSGIRWQLPDLEGSEENYRLAKKYFEADGRALRDATIDGHLEIFQKVDYDTLFNN